jgi:hypothetical protein
MNDDSIPAALAELRQQVQDVIAPGSFLLSTGELSRYWVRIGDLADATQGLIATIVAGCIPRFHRYAQIGTVFVPRLTMTSQDEHPLDFVPRDVPGLLASGDFPVKFVRVRFENHNQVDIPDTEGPGSWLGILTLSVHFDMIMTILDSLERRHHPVSHVLVVVEREKRTRESLTARGVNLVPMIICTGETGQARTIIEMTEEPYRQYHKFFIDEPAQG